jgi:hypothetical protein
MANGYFERDFIDQTKLDGSYDFDIEWTARGALAAKGSDGISMFDALEKQLGLKAELQDVPLPGMVIDSLNRRPSANPAGIASSLVLAAARFEAATIKPANPDDPRPMQGLIYTGGTRCGPGDPSLSDRPRDANFARSRRRHGARPSEVCRHANVGNQRQGAFHRRRNSERGERTGRSLRPSASGSRCCGDCSSTSSGSRHTPKTAR